MKETVVIPAKEVRAGDQIRTGDGFIDVGGVQELSADRVGLLTREGMLGVDAESRVTVLRDRD